MYSVLEPVFEMQRHSLQTARHSHTVISYPLCSVKNIEDTFRSCNSRPECLAWSLAEPSLHGTIRSRFERGVQKGWPGLTAAWDKAPSHLEGSSRKLLLTHRSSFV